MSDDEARRVARIACAADGGCSNCAARLIEYLMAEFPEHEATFRDTFLEVHGDVSTLEPLTLEPR